MMRTPLRSSSGSNRNYHTHRHHLLPLLLLLLLSIALSFAQVPSLDDLSGDWVTQDASKPLDTPAISNWRGSVGTNIDVVDMSSFIAPPLVGGPSLLNMRLDGERLSLEATKWSVFAASRRAHAVRQRNGDPLKVSTELRMVWNDTALLLKITLEKGASTKHTRRHLVQQQHHHHQEQERHDASHILELSVQAQARKLDRMGWLIFDPPQNLSEFETHLLQPASSVFQGSEEQNGRQAGAGGENTLTQRAMVLHADTLSDAVSGFVFAGPQPYQWEWVNNALNPKASTATGLISLNISSGETKVINVVMAMDALRPGETRQAALDGMTARLDNYATNFDRVFDEAKAGWEKVWKYAFTPRKERKEEHQLFSGHLPVLHTKDDDVSRLYYMGALSLMATGRTSVSAFGGENLSSYMTAHGTTCWTGDDISPSDVDCHKPLYPRQTTFAPVYIGGTAQFYWDSALRSLLTSLLDPAAMRRYIVAFLSLESLDDNFGMDALNGEPIGYVYAFNSHSVYTIMATYLRVTNDTALLEATVGGGATVQERLEKVALSWMDKQVPNFRNASIAFPRPHSLRGLSSTAANTTTSPAPSTFYLADHGGNLAHFLECLPTYIHAVPGIQGGNAEMLSHMANLRAAQGNTTGAEYFKDLARHVVQDTVKQLYVGGGAWGCMYPDNTVVPVRHVIDFIYISRGLEVAKREVGQGLPEKVMKDMVDYFHEELETSTWVRALSLKDALNDQVPRPASILRPDHGISGAFDAWASLSVEALAINEGNWNGALKVLKNMAVATKLGPFGQAHELDEGDASVIKTVRGWTRYTADNGASFSEVILRGLFGYQPPFLPTADLSLRYKGLEHAFVKMNESRGGLEAELTGLWTPHGNVDLRVGAAGVEIVNVEGG